MGVTIDPAAVTPREDKHVRLYKLEVEYSDRMIFGLRQLKGRITGEGVDPSSREPKDAPSLSLADVLNEHADYMAGKYDEILDLIVEIEAQLFG